MRVLTLFALIATPAAADCTAEIQALYDDGGANNAFTRPPHHQVQIIFDPDGNETMRFESRVETPLRTLAAVGTDCTLAVEDQYWTGPCWDGPWSLGGALPADRGAGIRTAMVEQQANVTEAECLGTVDLDGKEALMYRWRTQTNPDAAGGVSGEQATAYVDPETGRWLQWEARDIINPWQPEPTGEMTITTFTYDESIRVTAPD